ncbi:MAG: hypothetical protein L0H19_05430 [Salinisphaera sp.]|nr:hypothetical protein [Salinisphaera sp.]MDN5938187.1 hypothetical protein [Salinisphaera sp.]
MNQWRRIAAWTAMAGMLGTAAIAAPPDEPLSVKELAQCAGFIQTLRTRSEHLNQRAAAFAEKRAALAQQYQALQQGDNQQSVELWATYNTGAAAFNAKMETFRQALAKLALVKQAYTRQCANHPYRTADLEKLEPTAQEAMRKGMGGVRVPYSPSVQTAQ